MAKSTNNLFGNLGAPAKEPEEEISNTSQNVEDSEELTEAEKAAQAEPEEEEENEPEVSELSLLVQRAKMMGIKTDGLGVDELKAVIKAKLESDTPKPDAQDNDYEDPKPVVTAKTGKESHAEIRHRLKMENMRLIRIRITSLDPKDKDLPGQIFTVANEFIGNVSKYVPFGEATDEGYHVPYCIYKLLVAQKFMQIKTTKKNGRDHITKRQVRRFAIEELPQLTPAELKRLATAQIAAGSIDSEVSEEF